MAGTDTIRLYSAGTLLAIHWRCKGTLRRDVDLLLNALPIPRPLLGIVLQDNEEYMLFAHVGTVPTGSSVFQVRAPDGACLLKQKKKVQALTKCNHKAWPLKARERLWSALTRQAPRTFPQVEQASLLEAMTSFGHHDVVYAGLPDQGTYLCIRWPSDTASQVAPLRLEHFDYPDRRPKRVQALCLQDQKAVHLFIPSRVLALRAKDLIVLELTNGTRLPLVVPDVIEEHGKASIATMIGARSDAGQTLIDAYANRCIAALNSTPAADRRRTPVLKSGYCHSVLRVTSAGELEGWVEASTDSTDSLDLRIVMDDRPIGYVVAHHRPERTDIPSRAVGFTFTLPNIAFDGQEHALSIRVIKQSGERELDVRLPMQSQYSWKIRSFTPGEIRGTVCDMTHPLRIPELSVFSDDQLMQSAIVRSIGPNADETAHYPFSIQLDRAVAEAEVATVSLRIANSKLELASDTFCRVSCANVIRSLTELAENLNAQVSDTHSTVSERSVADWVRTRIIGNAINQLRAKRSLQGQLPIDLNFNLLGGRRSVTSSVVDIIVPVYRGKEETLACIRSVLEAKATTSYELVVINDCSPDEGLVNELRRLGKAGRFTYLENRTNGGFVSTVNRGMRLHPDRDVVLLNSDTVVPSGWLDRLRYAAFSDTNIATATPFSNNATICSFPNFCEDNTLPANTTSAELDTLFADCNARVTLDIPTAVGFCMYIKRTALDEVGLFDEVTWGKGYGEENDFCLRAATLGWRHVLAADLFVQHHGKVSFGSAQNELMSSNLLVLQGKYPDYLATVAAFIRKDPVVELRNNVMRAVFKRTASQPMLFVLPKLNGGTTKAAHDLAARLETEGCPVLILAPDKEQSAAWCLSRFDCPGRIIYTNNEARNRLVDDLQELGVRHIHYHHIIGFDRGVLDLPKHLNVAYDVTAHDYTAICPRINLLDGQNNYCDKRQFDTRQCATCLKLGGADDVLKALFVDLGDSISSWRTVFRDFLTHARAVHAPSRDVVNRFRSHYGLENLHYKPHPEQSFTSSHHWSPVTEGIIKVAIIGAIGPHKGIQRLRACAAHAQEHNLPLHFVVIGYTSDDQSLTGFDNVTITGEYRPEQLPEHIANYSCRIATFLSVCPETYTYTLSEALRYGLVPLAFDIGALGERIREVGVGKLLPIDATAEEINYALLKLALEEPSKPNAEVGAYYASILEHYYDMSALDGRRRRCAA